MQYGPLTLCRNSETDPDYDKPVSVIAGSGGFVDTKPKANADGVLVFDIPASTGSFRMFPYAHVYGWNGAMVQTWLPTVEN